MGQLQDDTAFVGEFYRTATNRCLNMLRGRRPQVELDADIAESSRQDVRPDHPGQSASNWRR
jgi:RNA polymerase sigma-70 factor (ECF subfamily)